MNDRSLSCSPVVVEAVTAGVQSQDWSPQTIPDTFFVARTSDFVTRKRKKIPVEGLHFFCILAALNLIGKIVVI